LWGNLRVRDNLKDLVVDGRILLKWIFKKRNSGMDWTVRVQGSERWRVLVNAVKKLRVP
jgi:hypothetical protein